MGQNLITFHGRSEVEEAFGPSEEKDKNGRFLVSLELGECPEEPHKSTLADERPTVSTGGGVLLLQVLSEVVLVCFLTGFRIETCTTVERKWMLFSLNRKCPEQREPSPAGCVSLESRRTGCRSRLEQVFALPFVGTDGYACSLCFAMRIAARCACALRRFFASSACSPSASRSGGLSRRSWRPAAGHAGPHSTRLRALHCSAAEQGLVRDRDEQKVGAAEGRHEQHARACFMLQVTISAFFGFSFLLCRREEPSALPRRSSK